jgi:hypothetical protein
MAGPAFQAVGTRVQSAGATTLSPAKPTVLGQNGVLLAVVTSKNNATHSTATSGWSKIGQINSGASFTASLWIAAESAAAIVPTWTGSVACSAQISYYASSDGVTSATIGGSSSNSGSTATHSTASFNSTANNSLVVYVDASAANTALATPSGWSERSDSGSATDAGDTVFGDKAIASSGSASGAISVTGANAAWVQWQIELVNAAATAGFQVSKAELDAWLDPLDGFNVAKAELGAWLDAKDGFNVAKADLHAWLDPAQQVAVGETLSDGTETLTSGSTYYRRLILPTDLEITTVWFKVAETSGSAQITGKLYADSAGALGSLLASSAAQTGTTANFADDLPLTSTVTLAAGTAVWVAISVAVVGVNGKVKKGAGAIANGTVVPDAYEIWLTGNAIVTQSSTPLVAMGSGITLAEGSSGETVFAFDVNRTVGLSATTSVDWALSYTGSNPAAAGDFVSGVVNYDRAPAGDMQGGSDYRVPAGDMNAGSDTRVGLITGASSGTITFAPGQSLAQIVVYVQGDTTVENDETFTITISNPTGGATITTATAIGTIATDDWAISPNSAAHAHAASSPGLAAGGTAITVNGATSAHTAGSPTLAAKSTAAPTNAAHAHTAGSPSLAAKSTVAPNGANHAHTASSPTITPNSFTADPDDAAHAHAASSPTLASKASIAPAGAHHAHSATSPSLAAKSSISPSNALHAHTAASPAISWRATITPASAAHAQAAGSPTLAAKATIAPASARHLHTASAPTIAAKWSIAPDDAVHAHTAGEPALAFRILIWPDSASHGHTATAPTLAWKGAITPANGYHAHSALAADVALRILPADSSPARRGIVPSYARHGIALDGARLADAPSFSRLGYVPGFSRFGLAPSLDRHGDVPGVVRSTILPGVARN